jgi:streptomycin 3"-adenylyltransferase
MFNRYRPPVSYRAADLPWRDQADRVAGVCVELVPNLVGVYVHGSAALGGFGPASDLDVLVVADGDAAWPTLGTELLVQGGRPRILELSVVQADACARPARPWPYVVHVNSSESRFNLDPGAGDPDLIAHYAVARTAGVAILGPPAVDVFGPVQPAELTDYLRGELRDALEHSDQRYAVLNACRAIAFAEDRLLLSKTDGARWWLRRFGPQPLVTEALRAQERGEDLGPCSAAARAFVATAAECL